MNRAGLSLLALDNRVDKPGQVLYDSAKCLICKGTARIACFLGRPQKRRQRLSRPALDNRVDILG